MKQKILFITIMICLALLLAGCTGAAAEGEKSEPTKPEAKASAAETKPSSSESKASTGEAKKKAVETTFTGYLVDVKCGYLGKGRLDGADLTAHPEKHTLECALSEESMASGYGLCMKDEKGVYKFFPFDADGSRMAKDVLEKSTRNDNMLVELKYVEENDMIQLVSITEIDKVEEAPKAETHE